MKKIESSNSKYNKNKIHKSKAHEIDGHTSIMKYKVVAHKI